MNKYKKCEEVCNSEIRGIGDQYHGIANRIRTYVFSGGEAQRKYELAWLIGQKFEQGLLMFR